MRQAFPEFHAEIHWQLADGDRVTTYKTYYGTHKGPFLGIAPTHRKIYFESVDVMRAAISESCCSSPAVKGKLACTATAPGRLSKQDLLLACDEANSDSA